MNTNSKLKLMNLIGTMAIVMYLRYTVMYLSSLTTVYISNSKINISNKGSTTNQKDDKHSRSDFLFSCNMPIA